MKSKAWQLALLLAVLCLCFTSAAAPAVEYTCPYVPAAGCDSKCQQAIGTALLQLHAGLRGDEGGKPWHGLMANSHDSDSLCHSHCKAVPAYCGWPGVLCCHDARMPSRPAVDKNCRHTEVEHDVCASSAYGAVWKLDLTMQKLGGRLSDEVIDALKVLTGYGLQAIDFSSNNLSGSIPGRIWELGKNLTTINLNFNKLTGAVPASISRLNLQHVFLSFNRLSGNLNAFCTKPTDPLQALIVRGNYFAGPVDLTNCRELLLLDLTDNQLTGSLPVGITNGQLVSFRATNNKFSGSISDDIWRLPMLTSVDLGSNDLTGTISEFCGTSNNLVNVYLGNNSLSGTLSKNLVSNSQLLQLELQNNTSLHGTFPSVGALVGLRRLDIHNTSISGTIPDEWGHLPYLEYVDISGTRMSCCTTQEQADNTSFPNLPSFLQFSKRYSQFDLSTPNGGTLMTSDADEGDGRQPNNILCRTVVRAPQSESQWNTLHLPVTTNAITAQKWLMSPVYFWFDECTCTKFYDKTSDRYLYHGVDSFWDEEHNRRLNVTPGPRLDMEIFFCQPIDRGALKPGTKAAIAIVVFLVCVGAIAYLMLAKASKLRRFLALSAIRIKGPPRNGRMSLVVTDIEGYSDIFKRSPEVMFKALVLHNSVLRAAKYHNGGFVLEQEGDSFTIAFYDAFDAVCFCLQAQQALLAVQWPQGLDQAQDQDAGNSVEGSMAVRRGSKLHMRLSPLLQLGPRLKRVSANASAPSMGSHVEHAPSFTPSALYASLMSTVGSKAQLYEPLLFNGLRVRMGVVTGEVPSGTSIKNSALFQLAKVVGDFGNGGQTILDEATFAAIKDSAQALGAVDASGLNHSKLSSGRAGWSRLLRLCGMARSHAPAEEIVLLDMGAFCRSSEDEELPYTTSRALDVKQPDGQQQPGSPRRRWWQKFSLGLCRPSSSGSLSDGGASADLSPPSAQQVQPLPPAAQASRPFLASSRLQGDYSGSISSSFAVSFGGPSASSPRSRGRAASSATLQQQRQQAGDLAAVPDAAPKQDGVAVVGRLASFSARATRQWADLRKSLNRSQSLQETQSTRRDWESVRLFQVLPPALAARAHVWHNQLNVKEGYVCWDNIYFEAPGSTTAPLTGGSLESLTRPNSSSALQLQQAPSQSHLSATMASPSAAGYAAGPLGSNGEGSSSLQVQHTGGSDCSSTVTHQGAYGISSPCLYPGSPMLQPLPPVTMVFMAVEGPEQLVRRRRPFTPLVQSLLNRVVRDALRRLGGYLCRVQEGDMKFMVAFGDPVTALEWCLLVQVAAMYLPWPQSAIMLLPSCREQVDSSGRLVFRGPRLKMGVCEGVPRSILPDHEGRADYHGQSINMAARFMDKGARGGQIACTLELAQQAMAVWAAGGGSSSFTCLCSPVAARHSIAEGLELGAAAAAAEAVPGGMGGRDQQEGGQGSGGSSWAAAAGSRERVQPLDIESAPEQGSAFAAAAAAGAACSSSGGSRGAGGAGGSRGPRSWWTAFSNPSAANLAAAAAAAAPERGDDTAAAAVQPQQGATAVGFGSPQPVEVATSVSVPLSPLLRAATGSPGCSDDAEAAGPLSTQSMSAAVPSGACRPGSPLVSPTSGPGSRSGQAAAAAGQAESAGAKQRATGASWPGDLGAPQQQQPQQGGVQQQRLAHVPPHLLLPRGRASSQDGSSGLLKQSSRSRLSSNHSQGLRAGSQAQLQAQALASAGPSTAGLGPRGLAQPPPVAPSPFVMRDVLRVPFRVEVQRLGLYKFKGGPAQQEMVQVLPTHLLGRAEVIAREPAPPASRKGQLLQRLEGRVGEPVLVQLPVLAQDYHESLNHRVSGITGLPHRCSSPMQATSSADAAAAAAVQPRGAGADAGAGAFWGQRGSRSVSLPAGRGLWAAGFAAAGTASASAGVRPAAAALVRSDVEEQAPERAGSPPPIASPGKGAGTAKQLHPASTSSAPEQPASHNISIEEPAGPSGFAASSAPQRQQQQQGFGQSSGAAAAGSPPHKGVQAEPGTAGESCLVDVSGLGRHDSFRSVDDGVVVGSDEEVGLSPPAAGGSGGDGLRSKSDPHFPRPSSATRQAS